MHTAHRNSGLPQPLPTQPPQPPQPTQPTQCLRPRLSRIGCLRRAALLPRLPAPAPCLSSVPA